MESVIEELRKYHKRQAELLAVYPNANMTVKSSEEHERNARLLAEIDALTAPPSSQLLEEAENKGGQKVIDLVASVLSNYRKRGSEAGLDEVTEGYMIGKLSQLIVEAIDSQNISFSAVSISVGVAEPGGWVPVTSFDQVKKGDSLLVMGNIGGVEQHLFHGVITKESVTDGQEIILRKKDNTYFNFGMYLDKKSWVKQCYKLQTPPTNA